MLTTHTLPHTHTQTFKAQAHPLIFKLSVFTNTNTSPDTFFSQKLKVFVHTKIPKRSLLFQLSKTSSEMILSLLVTIQPKDKN